MSSREGLISFVLRMTCVGVVCLLVFIVGDHIVTNGLKKTGYHDFQKFNDIFSGAIESKVLIVGGSDAAQHFSPSIISESLGQSTYNLGLAGHNFFMQNALFNAYMQKASVLPEVVIQVINPNYLKKRSDLYGYELFLPFLDDAKIEDAVKTYNGLDWADLKIPFVRYSGELDLIKIGFLEYFGLRKYPSNKDRGYYAYDRQWDGGALDDLKESFQKRDKNADFGFHAESIEMFKAYLKDLKDKNIQIILVFSPHYKEAIKEDPQWGQRMSFYKNLADEADVELLDYSDVEISGSKDNFYDFAHLNREMSLEFSKIVAEDIVSKNLLN